MSGNLHVHVVLVPITRASSYDVRRLEGSQFVSACKDQLSSRPHLHWNMSKLHSHFFQLSTVSQVLRHSCIWGSLNVVTGTHHTWSKMILFCALNFIQVFLETSCHSRCYLVCKTADENVPVPFSCALWNSAMSTRMYWVFYALYLDIDWRFYWCTCIWWQHTPFDSIDMQGSMLSITSDSTPESRLDKSSQASILNL